MTPIEYDVIVFKEEEKRVAWDSFIHSLNSFSNDFMNQRNQPALEKRESLFGMDSLLPKKTRPLSRKKHKIYG